MNNTCHNCGEPLNNNDKHCPNCGFKRFEESNNYKDTITKKITTKRIIIISISIFLIALAVTIIYLTKGVPIKVDTYDTSYNQDNYKCNKAINCKNGTCTYVDENGVEEEVQCQNTNWYNQN